VAAAGATSRIRDRARALAAVAYGCPPGGGLLAGADATATVHAGPATSDLAGRCRSRCRRV
jgi:hypothetical protein